MEHGEGDVSRETSRKRRWTRLEPKEFRRRLILSGGQGLDSPTIEALWVHYTDLLKWQRKVSLVGVGTQENLVERHYGESLKALRWLKGESGTAIDVGSGGGFPGIVLAAALPQFRWTLLEPRQKKWAFLRQVIRRMELPAKCLNVRLQDSASLLPQVVDCVTVRALKLTPEDWDALIPRLSDGARLILWCTELPALPAGFSTRDEVQLEGKSHARIVLAQLGSH